MKPKTTKIEVTSDKEKLTLVWSEKYAEAHAGKIYDAEIGPESRWAYAEKAKFPPDCYTIIG